MHTHKDTLKILNCSKMTLSRYVKQGKLEKIKKGRHTYYDEREVALLVKEIEDNKKKVGIEIKPPKKINLPDDVKTEIKELSADASLNKIGMEALMATTNNLIDMGLYEECDKQILLCYALSVQAYNYFFSKCMDLDGVSLSGDIIESEDGTVNIFIGKATVHPYHKMMMDHQKQMLQYSDRLGLNPLARQKFDIEEKKEKSILQGILDG